MNLETGVVTGWEIRKNRDGAAPKRLLQVIVSDPEDVQTVEWIGGQGEDDGIVLNSTVLIVPVGSTKYAFALDDGIQPAAADGEKKLYSIDSGAKAAEINLDKTGDIEIKAKAGGNINLKEAGELELNGNNDFLISFTQLQTILSQFALAINIELAKYTLLPAQVPIPVTIDITPAKTEKIKIGFP
jgi:hypothetical protein